MFRLEQTLVRNREIILYEDQESRNLFAKNRRIQKNNETNMRKVTHIHVMRIREIPATIVIIEAIRGVSSVRSLCCQYQFSRCIVWGWGRGIAYISFGYDPSAINNSTDLSPIYLH